jgi:CheY-like chemotaxis protein
MSAPAQRPRLLVADDARVMRMLLRTWLERLGCEVVEAASGAEALQALGALAETPGAVPFSGVLLDIHMPGLTGLQVLETMRQDARWKDLPTMIITTLGHQSDVERGLRIGATAYLTKPLGFPELMRALERMLPQHFVRRAVTPT